MGHFQIFVTGAPGSVEDWQTAFKAAEAEVPSLTDDEKQIVKHLQADEREYARVALVTRLSYRRNEATAKLLGEKVDQILLGIGSAYYQLSAVLRNESTSQQWVARIITPQGVKNV